MELEQKDGADLALLRGFVDRGDQAALGELLSRHADTAYRFALRLSRSPADAEDILQTAFLEVFRRASAFQGGASVRTWILGFVLNVSRNKAREESRRKARQAKACAGIEAQAPQSTMDPEVAAQVRRAVEDLPEHYRAPVWLHYGEGLSTSEVADVLDLSADTVRKQLSRGVDRLRERLLPYGIATSVLALIPALAVETAPPSVAASVLGAAPVAASGLKIGLASKIAAATVAAVALASSAGLLWWGEMRETRPPEFAEIERRVKEWQPTPEERRFDEIGWARTIREALRLSGESGRPVVLLTQSGRINLGRSDGGSQFLRARALSDPGVISLLNSSFVPVYVSNADHAPLGAGTPEEKQLRDRIWSKAHQAGLSWGMDYLYLVDPDGGRVVDTLELRYTTADGMRRWLERHRKTSPGGPLVRPAPQSAVPPVPSGSLALHLTARYLDAAGNVEKERIDYHEVPGEDWLVLAPDEWRQFIPAAGDARPVDAGLAERILTHVHPSDISIEDEPNGRNRIVVAEMRAIRVSRSYVRLEGRLEMRRTFNQVTPSAELPIVASLKGFVELQPGGREIRSLRLISEGATYGVHRFGAALRNP